MSSIRRLLGVAWLLFVVAVLFHQWHFWTTASLDADVLALLPADAATPALNQASRQLAAATQQQLVVLVGAADWPGAQQAADRVSAELARERRLKLDQNPERQAAAVAFFRPWRDRQLTAAQSQALTTLEPAAAQAIARLRLYQPAAAAALTGWRDDPLGLWADWWRQRAGESKARPRDGRLWLEGDGRQWVVLLYQVTGSAFSATGDTPLGDALQRAVAVSQAQVLAAGVPLLVEVAAAQASWEVNTIGWGSLAAVLLLVWLTFRSLRPIVLVGLSLGIGTLTALSVTAWIFGQVHWLTLVFGASLVGVAEDYGFHYFAARQGQPAQQSARILQHLLPGLTLALVTSVVAYLALGLAPFPGLRQMAVFAAVGLIAAFLTVVCWFPWLDRAELPVTRFAARCAASLQHWPRLERRHLLPALVASSVVLIGGWAQLPVQDDLRQLQGLPPERLADQIAVGRLLGLPSPAQYFLVAGDTADAVLVHEEALTARLDALVAAGRLPGYRASSQWVPSLARQRRNAELTATAEQSALTALSRELGEDLQRPSYPSPPLTIATVLDGPAAGVLQGLWLGPLAGRHYSLVMLQGLTPQHLADLQQAGRDLPDVRWVNKTADISALLAHYRVTMGWLLVLGYGAVLLALVWRFGRAAWRAWLPTALGSALTLACFGWWGVPLQLFTVLALLVLLGMGVDYGIFLLEHPGDGAAWLAVALAGISTLLAFGLLALSATPALRSFGLTMLIGEVSIWLLSPCFRPKATHRSGPMKFEIRSP